MPNAPAISEQYRAVHERGGLLIRDDRAVIEITGRDRATWLHNLVTNTVKTLSPGEGNYAFATNIKGRCVFDAGILLLEDRIWMDVDRRWLDVARKHLDRYIITEDVALVPREGAARFAVVGPAVGPFAARIGCGNLIAMAQWQHVAVSIGANARLVRNDFLGLPAADVFVVDPHGSDALATARTIAADLGVAEIGCATADILRIESGIPASVDDIDEDVVPPESGRIEQGISYHKGCYLGQEVIERMRAHNVLARRLVGIRFDAVGERPGVASASADVAAAHSDEGNEHSRVAGLPTKGATVARDGADIGRITSACWSEALNTPLALGYIKSAHTSPGTRLSVAMPGQTMEATVVALPVAAP